MTELIQILKRLLAVTPFLLMALLAMKANLKKENRSRQFAMPVLALIICIVAMSFLDRIYRLVCSLLTLVFSLVGRFIPALSSLLGRLNVGFLAFFAANFLLLLAYVILKRIVITILQKVFKTGNSLYEAVVRPFYEYDANEDRWFVHNSLGQMRGLLRAMYFGTLAICCLMMMFSATLYAGGGEASVFYPVFGVILMGELYFFLDGLTRLEFHHAVSVEEDAAAKHLNYSLMRQVLRKLFPDKLNGEATKANESEAEVPMEQILDRICQSDDAVAANYGRFMQGLYQNRLPIDRNYLFSGLELLQGKSVLFNNPFYRDYIPYIFYPINRTLLRSKKVLVILGRNGTQEDVKAWVQDGLTAVNSTPGLWQAEVLSQTMQDMPDVGIITRSDVHNQKLHEACAPFLAQTEFVVVMEPSKLLSTAQIGLNSIAKRLQRSHGTTVWCAIDKNCDGLVDALSHALLTNISEVTATERYSGISSYMLWDADHDHMQHRLLPNISRYLGFGTELSFAALKNQIDTTWWYGGEAFPVTDMHWIAKQYYYDLLSYAELPATQQTMDEKFITSPNLWNAAVQENAYLTVEDEAHNMFEMRRVFSTRAAGQGFVNILSDDYLLKDYMADNADIFEADAKAIPHIVADYVRSERNVALRMVLMMSSGAIREEELKKELSLIGVDDEEPIPALWALLCRSVNPIGTPVTRELILPGKRGLRQSFDSGVIQVRQKYDLESGKVCTLYYIDQPDFIRALVSDLQNADCIAEDEKGQTHFLGSKLRGHIFQKYLPGQFFTMDGKYYEMLTVTPQGQMLVRRAADHIDGRTCYRQERIYRISGMVDSDQMGAAREIGGMKVTRACADLTVDTPAYWQMSEYGNFATAKRVALNGIPRRTYYNKQLLRLQLPGEGLSRQVLYTITVLFNETFRSIFAENQPYLVAVMPGSEALGCNHPLTYTLEGEGVDLGENAIYLIEDSQMDLGLLVSAERSLKRVFETICDYLDWHAEALEKSLNPPPEPEIPDFRVQPLPEDGNVPQEKKKRKNPFKAIWEFLKKLFRPKRKKPEAGKPEEAPQNGEPETKEPVNAEPQIPAGEDPRSDEAQQTPSAPQAPEKDAGQPEAEPGDPAEDKAPEDGDTTKTGAGEEAAEAEDAEMQETAPEDDTQVQYSFSRSRGDLADRENPDAQTPEEQAEGGSGEDGITVEYEEAGAVWVSSVPVRRPYHERYFLLFGGSRLPEAIVPEQTLEYLKSLGYAENALKQARTNKNMAELIEKGLTGGADGHLCDFCGRPLSGIEHEVLSDGRERCSNCSRTAVRSGEEFEKILSGVLANINRFYGVQITVPVRVQMVNAKKLHRKLGKTFVPTGNADGRILGVAIKAKDGYSILVENGAPRIQSTMTLVHELSHIWQYLNWDRNAILYQYGKEQELELYEGMAKWVEIQYAYLIGETATARREQMVTSLRQDEYGRGFNKYLQCYPLSQDLQMPRHTPFENTQQPL